MFQVIQHRVNTLEAAKAIEPGLGAEIDLRTFGGEVILSHDPFTPGPSLKDFLKIWKCDARGTLILNVKEEGLESFVEDLLIKEGFSSTEYFFLDCAFPTLVRRTRDGVGPYSTRYSEYETIDSAMQLRNRARWVWVDCFSGEVPPESDVQTLASAFEVCLVSPELQGYPLDRIEKFGELFPYLSAVCTKQPGIWKSLKDAQTGADPSLLQRSEEPLTDL